MWNLNVWVELEKVVRSGRWCGLTGGLSIDFCEPIYARKCHVVVKTFEK